MDSNPAVGQGLNALIPPKKSSSEQNHKENSSPLEERINHKVNESVSHFPSELISQNNQGNHFYSDNNPATRQPSLETLKKDFQADFKAVITPEKPDEHLFQETISQKPPLAIAEKPLIQKQEEKIFQIETEKIKPNPYQPRRIFAEDSLKELADSIREFGILEPLLVTRMEKETDKGTEVEYQLIAGERRLMAAKILGLPTVPVIIKKPLEERKKLEIALIENIQREDLNLISKARAFERLINEFNLTQQELAVKMGKSREVIANTLRLLQLPLEIQKAIEENLINEGHARAILLFNAPDKRKLFFREILAKNLSGREAADLAQKYLLAGERTNYSSVRGKRQNFSLAPQDLEWKEKLEDFFQMPVAIKKKGDRGAIEIKFFSDKDFDIILKKLLSS